MQKLIIENHPARAGTTTADYHRIRILQDHPRSRGNNCHCERKAVVRRGSPPLAREQRWMTQEDHLPSRITPARAGTTPFPQVQVSQTQDHPRSRGNNVHIPALTYCLAGSPRSRGNNENAVLEAMQKAGSPPLAREQPSTMYCADSVTGITPARAGTTICYPIHKGRWGDHPRSRGNNSKIMCL